jgi:alcohol dehydrogenase
MIRPDRPSGDPNGHARETTMGVAVRAKASSLRRRRRQSATLSKFLVPEVVFGDGALAEVGHAARRLGARRVFLVSDPGIVEAGWVDLLERHLRDVGLEIHRWTEVTPNTKDHEVEAGHHRYVTSGCDVIVGLGGGSVLDAATGIAIVAGNGGCILDYAGVDLVVEAIPPLVLCPTTSGTGADVSQFCVITDTERRIKRTIIGRSLVPDISITDPRLLITMPDDLNAATGLDALTHGIEAFVSRAAGPLTDDHAIAAIALIGANLERTLDVPADLVARTAMAEGSLRAGFAFTNAILGATHALSHQVGGALDLPHGVVNGVLLEHVIRFNAAKDPEAYRAISGALGCGTQGPAEELAEGVATAVRELADTVGVPRTLGALGVGPGDINAMAGNALDDACLRTNPRDTTHADLAAILRAAL